MMNDPCALSLNCHTASPAHQDDFYFLGVIFNDMYGTSKVTGSEVMKAEYVYLTLL